MSEYWINKKEFKEHQILNYKPADADLRPDEWIHVIEVKRAINEKEKCNECEWGEK